MELSQSEREKILNESDIEIFLNNKDRITRDCVLKYLSVENYQGIKSLVLNNLPNDAQWIFLTGENGYGKTSVLRAIAKGLLGDEELVSQIDKNTKITSGIHCFNAIYPHLVDKGQRNYNNLSINIAGYGIDRFRHNDKNYGDAYTLFEDGGTLLSIEKLLITADEIAFEKIKTIFKRIIPNLADIKKINKNGFYEIRYQEKNEQGDIFDLVKLNDLAAGYRGIITMIGDMMRRFNNYFQKSFDDVTGIVIIDEFDAHLHPKYQYELPKLLSTVFPKIQFIVSTHSPIPLLGVEPNTAVVLTVNRTKELGITVERLDDDIPFHHLLPNSLLTSPIFGFENLFPRDTPISEIASSDHWKDVEESINLQKELEQLKADGLID
jgi:predicted ATP-dependent endonuclease of OLD family